MSLQVQGNGFRVHLDGALGDYLLPDGQRLTFTLEKAGYTVTSPCAAVIPVDGSPVECSTIILSQDTQTLEALNVNATVSVVNALGFLSGLACFYICWRSFHSSSWHL